MSDNLLDRLKTDPDAPVKLNSYNVCVRLVFSPIASVQNSKTFISQTAESATSQALWEMRHQYGENYDHYEILECVQVG